MGTDAIELGIDDGVATLTLSRPDTGNAINRQFVSALRAHAEGLTDRADVRVVIIRSTGRNFCVGGDLAYFAGITRIEPEMRELATDFHAGIHALRALDAPLVAGIQGAAAGGGVAIACACDIVLAARSARFTMAYTAAGLSVDGGASWFLPRLVGWRRATELILSNRVLSAAEAAEAGLITEVVADDALSVELQAMAVRLAAGPARAFGSVKRLLQASSTASLLEQLDAEACEIAANAASADGREGVSAFLARRAPEFRSGGRR
jgi:2-(1,2-epoxy-1,2-dihydrophenyl)acetyl-CoA isomerase